MLDPTATTHSLLHPPTSTSCLPEEQHGFDAAYSGSQLVNIYKGIGKDLSMETVEKVFDIGKEKSTVGKKEKDGMMSLKSFQEILNRME